MSDENPVTALGPATRRALFVGAGAVGATAFLAACGSDDGGDTGAPADPGADASEDPGATEDPGGGAAPLGKVSEIPVGGGAIFAGAQVVVTQPTEGTFKGFRSICTHQGCPIASVDGGTINCSCHGSKFSIEDGTARNGPATRPLTEQAVAVEGDNIVLA
jgi:nitrite reductase/ring-hydroxylating ferredoxin subunit